MAQQQNEKTGFKTIILIKEQTLGVGSYGAVCKAKCDDLLCAAKIIHPTLYNPTALHQIAPHREHRLPIRRFQLECEFLSTIRHPNVVQYLGTHQDPDTGLPVLLMELMDDSLTHFLESSPQPIPYHIQVNICHDITLALSFLHSNGIVHRDLSSNNVLLIGNVRAKVTDFGMARLGDQNPQATQLTFTMCPGTDVYMPPEAVKDKPEYTEKIDCFSFGVITVQIITRQFPKPGDRLVTINDSRYPQGTLKLCVPEIERRQNHISKIDPNHTLLQVALNCLKDRDVERPSAHQLCERVAVLKEDPQYSESVRVVEERSSAEQQIIQSQTSRLEEKDQTITQKDETITELGQRIRQLEREKGLVIEEKEGELRLKVGEINRLERRLGRVNQRLEESERVIVQFQRRITQLEQLRPATDTLISGKEQNGSINLTWREGEKAPYAMSMSHCAAVDGSTLYVSVSSTCLMVSYTISSSRWSHLPDSPTTLCPSAIINNLLTLVGGYHIHGTLTNQLFSLTGEGSDKGWTVEFPPMPTNRWGSIALCTETALIVAGGRDKERSTLQTTEVLNTETLQWSTAADLPQPLSFAPATVCGDQIYTLGKSNMFICSVAALIQSCKSFLASIRNRDTRVWKEVSAPPVLDTTCVSIHDRLLVIGGRDSDKKTTTAIHMYNATTDSWEIISHMGTPRCRCIAAVLPNNQLMVVGGKTSENVETDSVEISSSE